MKDIIRKIYYSLHGKYKAYKNYKIMPKRVHKFFVNSPYPEKLRALKDIHKGERCFVIGNGPSLRAEDLDKLKGEYTFASNFIGKIFDKNEWRPTYFCVMDPKYVRENIGDFLKYEKEQMFVAVYAENFEGAKQWFGNPDIIFCEMTHGAGEGKLPGFSDDVSKIMYGGYSVTYCLLQLAVHMGFKEIYLLGVDNNFAVNKGFNGVINDGGNKEGHFYKSSRQESGNVEGMTNAYEAARIYAEKNNIKIYNSTRGGKLETYERKSFDSIENLN